MTHTLKSIGFVSAVKISAVVSAACAVIPIIIFLLLNYLFKFWDVIIPPDVLGPMLAAAAFWAALTGGISTGIVVAIYNICAHFLAASRSSFSPSLPRAKAKRKSTSSSLRRTQDFGHQRASRRSRSPFPRVGPEEWTRFFYPIPGPSPSQWGRVTRL